MISGNSKFHSPDMLSAIHITGEMASCLVRSDQYVVRMKSGGGFPGNLLGKIQGFSGFRNYLCFRYVGTVLIFDVGLCGWLHVCFGRVRIVACYAEK